MPIHSEMGEYNDGNGTFKLFKNWEDPRRTRRPKFDNWRKGCIFWKNNSLIADRKNLATFYFTDHVTCKKWNIKFFRQNFSFIQVFRSQEENYDWGCKLSLGRQAAG